MKLISHNYFTGQIKEVAYIFHGNGDSLDMIPVTIIQPKIHKSNGLKSRICFHHFYFNLFSLHFISGHNSKQQLQIFFQKQSHIFSFQKQPHVL